MGGRIQEVARLERVFASAPMQVLRPLGSGSRGFNGVPDLVRLTDAASGASMLAVNKPAFAQLPQEAFAWRMIRQMHAEDLFAVTVPRANPAEGYVIELATGTAPRSLDEVMQALRASHGTSSSAERAATVDLHRMLGVDWVLANADHHLGQMAVTATGMLGFDHGHLGYRLTSTGSKLTVPMHSALLGAAGVSASLRRPGTLKLEPEAVRRLLAGTSVEAIRKAHAETLASWHGPVHPDFAKTSSFASSSEYLDGVLARIEHLRQTGTITFVNRDLVR